MAQLFSPAADLRLRLFLVLMALGILGLFLGAGELMNSDWVTGLGMPSVAQPVPFSHRHHVGGLGLDCRYCHTSVETAASAGFPPTHTCMTCHSQIWTGAAMLEPVRRSLAEGRALRWRRVNDLPDFVYFNHSVHVARGVGCSTCHGAVDRMPLVEKAHSLTMGWCLDCHRDPAPALRDRSDVFAMDWTPPPDQRARGEARMRTLGIHPERLDDCGLCHR
ncbi:cytochrome c3 family protein [Azospirillum doebereinerae]|uniref:Cytochrome C n=1 Tax=Azospirillum doebereinerae TaxID=92933 RepID=A0A433J4L7_9PROT|nr:cytochrome c3 family protein [Azospirillum doebereinerae]MCG5239733.1 cytochrome c family protein [Azospirillum doebereinerae]RUQ67128.1 cytochrome C [Azospirillum doebereinerae]